MKNTTKNVVQYGTAVGPSGYWQITWDFQTGPFFLHVYQFYHFMHEGCMLVEGTLSQCTPQTRDVTVKAPFLT